ncbi:MAG: serine O-acetyltransferase, partial [Opitutales bacterium]
MNDTNKTIDCPDIDRFWDALRHLAAAMLEREPALKTLLHETVIDRTSFAESLTHRLTRKLANHAASIEVLHETFLQAFNEDPQILEQIAMDMRA